MKQKLKIQKLTNAWTNPTTDGIFHRLQTLDVPWQELNIDASLDIQYHFNRSGEKIVAPLISSFSDNENALTSEQKSTITNVVFNMFSNKWSKLYELLSLEFDPIENYNMSESEVIDRDTTDRTTHTGTQGTTHTGTQGHSETRGVTVTFGGSGTSTGSGSNSSEIYGFNSTTAVGDSDTSTSTSTSTSTQSTEGTQETTNDTRTDNLTDTRTDNLTDAGTGTEDVTRTLIRSGNIGVTTSQQMIQSSIDLWQWNFFDTVFRDIDSILTIQTY